MYGLKPVPFKSIQVFFKSPWLFFKMQGFSSSLKDIPIGMPFRLRGSW
jgi:hypothetical protein